MHRRLSITDANGQDLIQIAYQSASERPGSGWDGRKARRLCLRLSAIAGGGYAHPTASVRVDVVSCTLATLNPKTASKFHSAIERNQMQKNRRPHNGAFILLRFTSLLHTMTCRGDDEKG